MKTQQNPNTISALLQTAGRTVASSQGSVLVYLVLVLLIFGVLGVTIASLFSSATTSSATPNDARRAYYVAESGVRYALSRIRNANFHPDFIKEINNTPQYTLNNGSSFSINVFSPWFISPSIQDTSVNTIFTLAVPNEGKIPDGFSIPDTNVWLVNWNQFNGDMGNTGSYTLIAGSATSAESKSLTITMAGSDDLLANKDDIVCLAVKPTSPYPGSVLQPGDDIYVAVEAKDFFPPRNGAIRIVTPDPQIGEYTYEKLIDESTRVKLTNLAPLPGATFSNIAFSSDDWVVLSRYNYRVISTGKSGDIINEIGQNKQIWFFRPLGDWTITEREFIEDAVPNVTGDNVIETQLGVTEDDDEIQFGEDTSSDPGFGTIWYGGDKPIGGSNNFCQSGRCLFQDGIRAFFTLQIQDNGGNGGEGFIFALIAAGDDGTGNPVNTRDSAGGDFESSELLGYAGDSRIDSLPQFLDESGDGLKPPKIGLEIDTRTQFDQTFNQNLEYCSGSSLNPDTRNDPPDSGHQDAVQLIFWGLEDPPYTLNIPCRADSPRKVSYDDNRHDAEDIRLQWIFPTLDNVISGPAIGDDGTIYVGSNDDNLYAVNPDGSKKWNLNTGADVRTSPVIGPDGTLYAGSDNGRIYAFDPAAAPTRKWEFAAVGPLSLGRLGIGPDGSIIFTASNLNDGLVYALNPDGSPKWNFSLGPLTGGRSDHSPGVDPGNGKIYVDLNNDRLVAIDSDGTELWTFYMDADVDSTPTVAKDGTVYFASDVVGDVSDPDPFFPASPGAVFAINPTDRSNGDAFPVLGNEWRFDTGDENDSSPAIGPDGTIYVGSDDDNVYAINRNGSQKWSFPTGGNVNSSPTVGPDGNIYVGSNDGNIYALHPDGTPKPAPWPFDTNSNVRSTAAVDDDLTVYIGSNDNNLWAINQLALPRSYRNDTIKESKKLVSAADFPTISFSDPDNWLPDGDGLWAVRMEIDRETFSEGGESKGRYTIKAWVEKCSDSGCSKVLNSLYRDTLVTYNVSGIPPKLEQVIELSEADHDKLYRILFGFTTAVASNDTQESIIKFFELSFIRPTDPEVTSDPNLEG